MSLYPNAYFQKVEDITIEFLIKRKIKVLILDVDNTLVDYHKTFSEIKIQWVKELNGQGIKLYLLSNTNDKQKVEEIAKKLKIDYQYFAMKPLKRGFLKIQKQVNEKSEQIGVVGDQIFTDVLGGNRCHMFTILVEPIHPKDFWYTAWKRPIENHIKQKIKKQIITKEK